MAITFSATNIELGIITYKIKQRTLFIIGATAFTNGAAISLFLIEWYKQTLKHQQQLVHELMRQERANPFSMDCRFII